MIKRDQRNCRKEHLAFGDHRVRVSPDFQIKAVAQRGNRRLKSGNTVIVVFEDQDGLFYVHIQQGISFHARSLGTMA